MTHETGLATSEPTTSPNGQNAARAGTAIPIPDEFVDLVAERAAALVADQQAPADDGYLDVAGAARVPLLLDLAHLLAGLGPAHPLRERRLPRPLRPRRAARVGAEGRGEVPVDEPQRVAQALPTTPELRHDPQTKHLQVDGGVVIQRTLIFEGVTPPSLNAIGYRSHWAVGRRHKLRWQADIATMLMARPGSPRPRPG